MSVLSTSGIAIHGYSNFQTTPYDRLLFSNSSFSYTYLLL